MNGLRLITGLLLVAGSLFTGCIAAEQRFSFQPFTVPDDGRIVVPVREGDTLSGVAAVIDKSTGGAVSAAAVEVGFQGKLNKTLSLYGIAPFSRIDLIGLGDSSIDRNDAEDFGGTAAALLSDTEGGSVKILWQPENLAAGATAARVAFGYQLRSYRFDHYQEKRKDPELRPEIVLLSDDQSAAEFSDDLLHVARGVFFARDMSSEPANVIYPQSFVVRAQALFNDVDTVRIKVLDESELQTLGMGAHWGVGKGSVRPPRLLIIEYLPDEDSPAIVLAGKGITFDTGGISLKSNKGMWAMKGDLGGAGVVTGVAYAAARRHAEVNLVAVAALAENMPSGSATRPGDILTTMSGKTVEVLSTDAEGRLVLSDAVHYAQITYEPEVLIDVATLTGAVGRALGDDYAGLFSRHDDLADVLTSAGQAANEPVWRLPLDQSHFEQIKSKYADIKNSDAGDPGASAGAAFIGSFVSEDQPWVHLDIAGVDKLDKAIPTIPAGYSGWGVRLLDEYLRRLE